MFSRKLIDFRGTQIHFNYNYYYLEKQIYAFTKFYKQGINIILNK